MTQYGKILVSLPSYCIHSFYTQTVFLHRKVSIQPSFEWKAEGTACWERFKYLVWKIGIEANKYCMYERRHLLTVLLGIYFPYF
jgi:hypothetical protein